MSNGTLLEFQRQVAFQVEEMADGKDMNCVCKWIVMNLDIAALIEVEWSRGTGHYKTAKLVFSRISGEQAVAALERELKAQIKE